MAYSDKEKTDIFNFICKEIEKGNSLRQVLRDNENMPSTSTLYQWIDSDKEKTKQYARSCELRADILFDEMIEIADTPIDGIVIETDDNGRTKERKGDMLGHRRLQVDTRKWILSKMNPKKYGDKTDITTNGKEIGSKYSDWTDEQIAAEIERIKNK